MADYNLTGSFNQNLNPWDIIPIGSTSDLFGAKLTEYRRWNFFQTWLGTIGNPNSPTPPSNLILQAGERVVGNAILNTEQNGKPITKWFIDTYNSLPTTSDINKITDTDIRNIQVFTEKANPPETIRIDNWVGSQTSRMRYPDLESVWKGRNFNDRRPVRTDGYIGLIWGNKRIVVKASALNETIEDANGKKSPYVKSRLPKFEGDNYLPYENDEIYRNKYNPTGERPLQSDTLPGGWNKLNTPTIITQSPNQVNQQTQQQQQNNNKSKQGTQAVTNITQPPK
jgi:hypothetical protein